MVIFVTSLVHMICTHRLEGECKDIINIFFSFLLLLVFICILGLAHIFFIINTTPMCIFYTREISLKSYFLYIQQLAYGKAPTIDLYRVGLENISNLVLDNV